MFFAQYGECSLGEPVKPANTLQGSALSLTLFEVTLFMVVMRKARYKPEALARETLSLAGASGL
ncbi:MAG TPA: hypothetical protein VG122_11240 [Gemmata sp.]|jgi:hypothetical protein|nr:hypothetical protein [Gemmata sp.]